MSFPSFLACKVFVEKSAYSLIGAPLSMTSHFSLAAFKILSSFLTFDNLILMCLVFLCSSINLGSFGPHESGCLFLSLSLGSFQPSLL